MLFLCLTCMAHLKLKLMNENYCELNTPAFKDFDLGIKLVKLKGHFRVALNLIMKGRLRA